MAKKKPSKQLAVVSDTAVKELSLAYKRINGAPTRRLQWLLSLAELNIDAVSEGRLADLRWEIVAFGIGRSPDQLTNQFDYFLDFHTLTSPLPLERFIPQAEIDKHHPILKTDNEYRRHQAAQEQERNKGAPIWLVKEFQLTLKQMFDALFSGEQWRFQRPAQEEAIALTHIKTAAGARWAHNPPAYTAEELLLSKTIDLIKPEWPRLRICQNPKCQKRFVAAKKGRAFFHNPKCSAYVRVNKARGKM